MRADIGLLGMDDDLLLGEVDFVRREIVGASEVRQ